MAGRLAQLQESVDTVADRVHGHARLLDDVARRMGQLDSDIREGSRRTDAMLFAGRGGAPQPQPPAWPPGRGGSCSSSAGSRGSSSRRRRPGVAQWRHVPTTSEEEDELAGDTDGSGGSDSDDASYCQSDGEDESDDSWVS